VRRRSGLAAPLALLFGLALPIWPAQGMQFEAVVSASNGPVISGRGPIIKGDAARLAQALASVPATQQVVALALDSPGGNVAEAEAVGSLISDHRLPVVIPTGSQCVSACFLLLAASPRRFAASDALVGVHSANENGSETDTSLAVTMLMARDAADMGVPPAIIGKMVQTTPGRVAWLTHEDLASMNVAFLDDKPRPSVAPPVPPVPSSPTPPHPATAPTPANFATWRDDRLAWDTWLSGLRGAYRDGALFALSQIGLPAPGSCYGANGANRGDFTLGCEIGRQRLAPVAVKIAGDRDYANGWNGAGQRSGIGEGSEAEYQGAYFCGRQVARIELKVLPATAESRRRAILSFGPQPTSPEVPRGVFIVEGSIDSHGGAMALSPVKWVTQPAGYDWLGLNGHSDDDGKTFSGRVVDSKACTVFTLRRVSAVSAAK
jgi:ribosomal protein L18